MGSKPQRRSGEPSREPLTLDRLEELSDVDAEGLGPGELVGSNACERGLEHGVASLLHG
jgi:hypothetical protein